jgi:excisionase family DNA binding protein
VTDEPKQHRFLTPTQAADELNVKPNQIHALIKAGELRALQVGGRGMWRIGRQDLEEYVTDAYRRTAERIAAGEISDEGSR